MSEVALREFLRLLCVNSCGRLGESGGMMMKDGVLREEVVELSLNFCNFARLMFKIL